MYTVHLLVKYDTKCVPHSHACDQCNKQRIIPRKMLKKNQQNPKKMKKEYERKQRIKMVKKQKQKKK